MFIIHNASSLPTPAGNLLVEHCAFATKGIAAAGFWPLLS